MQGRLILEHSSTVGHKVQRSRGACRRGYPKNVNLKLRNAFRIHLWGLIFYFGAGAKGSSKTARGTIHIF